MQGFSVRGGVWGAINLPLTYIPHNNVGIIYVINLILTYACPMIRTEKCGAPCHPVLPVSLAARIKY